LAAGRLRPRGSKRCTYRLAPRGRAARPRECSIRCADDGSCPSRLSCAADGFCHGADTPSCEPAPPTGCPACDQPPPDECLDSCRLTRYAASGECQADRCEYPTTTVECQFGCLGGACQPEANEIAGCFDALCGNDCKLRFEAPGIFSVALPAACRRAEARVWGAGGGHGASNGKAGAGGFAYGRLDLATGASLIAVVGGPGGSTTSSAPGQGGDPGGGGPGGRSNSQGGGGGGGFSGLFDGEVSAAQAIVIAGGGGGSGGGSPPQAGAGGGMAGESAENGAGGSQSAGFAPLLGAPGGNQSSGDGGGGGGGGYFGGAGGTGQNSDAKSGGGGSGFAAGGASEALLESGSARTAGNAGDPDRGDAGNPARPGRVLVDCILLWER
jgi:hypothetical protein